MHVEADDPDGDWTREGVFQVGPGVYRIPLPLPHDGLRAVNVYPREIEEVLAHHPQVAQVAVIGVPDSLFGEEVCAVIVPEKGPDGSLPTAEELIAWSQERLGRHKYPRQVRFVDDLPLGPSMKVLKRELRRTIAAAG